MINQLLHLQPVAVDSNQHKTTKLRVPITDWSVTARLNSTFCAVTEFGDACRDFPLVFVNTGKDDQGKPLIAPIAVLGLAQEDNLFLDGTAWRGRYMPAVIRAYPFCTARVNEERFAVCMDGSWAGLSQTDGEALFTADGKPTPLLEAAQQQLEVLEAEIGRTRAACQRLVELDLLRDMRFDATLPDGRNHTVDGFLTVDQERMNAQSDAVVLELAKNGMLGMIQAHWISLGNMRHLLEWHMVRHPAPAASSTSSAQ
jgi:hypothetical protein